MISLICYSENRKSMKTIQRSVISRDSERKGRRDGTQGIFKNNKTTLCDTVTMST